jgi:Pentapeptide repeats (8 copies)
VTAGWAIVLLLLAFAVLSVLEGVAVGFNVFAVAFVAAVLMAAIGPIFATLINPLAFAVSSAIALAITIVSSVAALTVLATIVALAAYRAFNLAAAGAIVLIYIGVFGYIVSITKIVTSVVPVVPAVIVLSGYLGWRAMQGDPKHRFMRQLARTLVVRWGTSFRDADLTRANFSNATLKNVNFDQANLYRVCWTDKPPEQTILSSTNLS